MASLTALLIAATIIAASNYLFVPFSEHASQPWHKSASAALDRLQRLFMKIGDRSGLISEVTIRRLFTNMGSLYSPIPDGIQISTITIEGVSVLRHQSMTLEGQGHPALVYIHGGGWISGSAENYRALTSHISSEGQLVVFSINYRLAPEHVFPAAHDDCLKVTAAILKQAEEYGLDRNKIGIAGDEVGGNIALSVALALLEDPNLPDVCMTGVFYAPLQVADFLLPSYVTYGSGPASLQKNDAIDNIMYYIFGEKRYDVKKHLVGNLQTRPDFWETDRSRRIDIDLLPFSFRDARPKTIQRDGGNRTLVKVLEKFVLDPRLSPLFAAGDRLQTLKYLYFICPDIDPLRDESFMLYEFIRDVDMMILDHIYYRSESHGFLQDFRFNEVARAAITNFLVKFNDICDDE